MRAAIFERQGLDNLIIKEDVQQPTITDHDVLIKVKSAGVNPIDYSTVSNMPGIKALPHIPGVEVTGIIEKVGNHVTALKEGEKVVVYNSIFDGTCDMCINGYEMLCRNAGILGVITNGGFADYISAPEKNVFKIPDNVQSDVAASLATTTKTPYHALREASLNNTRIVNYADGWLPVAGFGPLEQIEQAINGLREGARKVDKDPSKIRIFVLTYPNMLLDSSSSAESSSKQQRLPMTGTTDQIGSDIEQIKAMDVEHIIFGHVFSAIAKDMKKTIELTKQFARFAR